ncbi:MAG TPA: mechanosensitive ion channel family protein [Ignavibacteriaceae bacterium]|nr:mechanosensitive ion channel family protein [Ignavibacteriaceae bacterium]
MKQRIARFSALTILIFAVCITAFTTAQNRASNEVPVVISGDTLFFVKTNIGPFTAEQRVTEIIRKINSIIKNDGNADSIKTEDYSGYTNIILNKRIILSITDADAELAGRKRADLSKELITILKEKINTEGEHYSSKLLIINGAITLGLLILLGLILWLLTKIFPRAYAFIESLEGKLFRSIKFRDLEIISAENISSFFIILLKGIRLFISLLLFYALIVHVFSLFPWTKDINIRPLLRGSILSIALIISTYVILKSVYASLKAISNKSNSWKGSLIKSVRIKNLEVISEERILEQVRFGLRILRFVLTIIIAYFFFTLLFSFFEFSKNWAATLINYIIDPLFSVVNSFVKYLPSLFTIIVIVFVTRYILKFIKFIFNELERGTISFQRFPPEWADPTYKIVRFLFLAFAAIIIFPYLPGSDSPAFQGVSVFLGILFSLGSSSAIANMVSGVVITYMRPFKIGDRVKIADTMGDVIEKTLLVTRVRTIKNVDVSIPNAMVLGSHIINFSSSAKDKGLILHTTVTIGYDVPWKKIHELLKSAAKSTENILKKPEPFVLQISLDDSYVSYELNAITDKPGAMAKIYSDLHQNIQDKFNEAGVEIMSPRYSAVRDGNQTAIPEDYLPNGYKPKSFRILPFGNLFDRKENPEK